MMFVVDANIIFSALLSKGSRAFDLFAANRIFKTFEFIAPDYLFFEIDKHMDKIISLTKLSRQEIADVFSFLKREIEFVSAGTFWDKANEARKLAQHEKDVPYIALAIKLGCPIVSGDKGMRRQSKVKILSPKEALSLLYELKENFKK